jgi:hypothetical protein
MDWHALENKDITPPFVPKIESDLDLRNIDRMFTREMPRETPEDSMLLQKKKFEAFTYVEKSLIAEGE